MRLWSFHPAYLDPKGLVALWREGLLALAVLRNRTTGYRRHPQLERFRNSCDPANAVVAYLRSVHTEASRRGYRFDGSKLPPSGRRFRGKLTVTNRQIDYEWRHFQQKLLKRNRAHGRTLAAIARPDPHPLFTVVRGPVEKWEKVHGQGKR